MKGLTPKFTGKIAVAKRRQIFPVQRLVGPAELAHEIGPTDSLHWLLQGVGDTGKAIFGSSLRL